MPVTRAGAVEVVPFSPGDPDTRDETPRVSVVADEVRSNVLEEALPLPRGAMPLLNLDHLVAEHGEFAKVEQLAW